MNKLTERIRVLLKDSLQDKESRAVELHALLTEAVVVLETQDDINIKQMIDDLIYLAANAGDCPPRLQ